MYDRLKNPGELSEITKCLEIIMPIREREVVVVNKCQCRKCGDIIESKHGHDFVYCKCGAIFTDGGKNYIHRGANDINDIIDMSETYIETYESEW